MLSTKLKTRLSIFALAASIAGASTAYASEPNSDALSEVLIQCEIDAVKADSYDRIRETALAAQMQNSELRGVISALQVSQENYERVFKQTGRLETERDSARFQRWLFLGGGVAAGILLTVGVFLAAAN